MPPLGKHKINHRQYLNEVLNDITSNNYRITQYIGDNPKRSFAKDCKCFSSWYPCEYCFAKGKKIELIDNSRAKNRLMQQVTLIGEKISDCEKEPASPERNNKISSLSMLKNELTKSINSLNRKTNILWPSSTMNCQPRTRNCILEIVEKIENNEQPLSIDEAKGIIRRSLLLDIPNFNFVYDVPAEYLHCACLGSVKRMVELTFNVGEKRSRVTKRKLSTTQSFDTQMLKTKVFKECSRRARKLDFAVFKGEEFRNIAIFFSH